MDIMTQGGKDPWKSVVSLCEMIDHQILVIEDIKQLAHSGDISCEDVCFINSLPVGAGTVVVPSLEGYGSVGASMLLATVSLEAAEDRLSSLWERLKVTLVKAMRHAEIIVDRAFTGLDEAHSKASEMGKLIDKASGKPRQANLSFHAPGRIMIGGKVPSNLPREVNELKRVAEQLYGQYGSDLSRFYREVKDYFSEGGSIKPITVTPPKFHSARIPYKGKEYKDPMLTTGNLLGDYVIVTPKDSESSELTSIKSVGTNKNTELVLPTLTLDVNWSLMRAVSELLSSTKTFQRKEIELRKVRVEILSSIDKFSKKEATDKETKAFNAALRVFAANHTDVLRNMTVHILRVSRGLIQYSGKSVEQYTTNGD